MKKTRPQPQSGGELVARNRGCGYTFSIREGKGVGKVMDWREEIRRRREEKHLSQEELAEAVGVSRPAVSKWESGAAQPTGANRRALLQALDLREAPAGPRLQSVRFYDEAMQEVLPEANWYDADRAVCLLVQWEGGTPATVQLVFTPAGSETAGEAQILAAALPLDGEHAALLSAAALRESGAGHLQILLDFGAEGIVRSEGAYNVAPLDPAVAA